MVRGRREKFNEDLKRFAADLKRNNKDIKPDEIQNEIKSHLIDVIMADEKISHADAVKQIKTKDLLPGVSSIAHYLTEINPGLKELSPLDKPWNIGMLKDSPPPADVVARILRLQKLKHDLTVRDVQWFKIFHGAFPNDKKLLQVIMTYGLWEIFSEITGKEFDTSELDHLLATNGDITKFIRAKGLAHQTKDAITAAFCQYEGVANGKDTLKEIESLKGEKNKPKEDMTIEWDKDGEK